jgi:hypothetical protein
VSLRSQTGCLNRGIKIQTVCGDQCDKKCFGKSAKCSKKSPNNETCSEKNSHVNIFLWKATTLHALWRDSILWCIHSSDPLGGR